MVHSRNAVLWHTGLMCVLIGCMLLSFCGCGSPAAAPQLRISAMPEIEPELLIQQMEQLAPYLSTSCDRPFTFIPALDRSELLTALQQNRIDLAYMDASGFSQVRDMGACRIVIPSSEMAATAVILTSKQSGITDLQSLVQREFLCTFQNSALGHLIPVSLRLQNGQRLEQQLRLIRFTMNARELCRMLRERQADAGVIANVDWHTLAVEYPDLKVLATTPPIPNNSWVASPGIDQKLLQSLTDAFLRLNWDHPFHRRILEILGTREFLRIQPDVFAPVDSQMSVLMRTKRTGTE